MRNITAILPAIEQVLVDKSDLDEKIYGKSLRENDKHSFYIAPEWIPKNASESLLHQYNMLEKNK